MIRTFDNISKISNILHCTLRQHPSSNFGNQKIRRFLSLLQFAEMVDVKPSTKKRKRVEIGSAAPAVDDAVKANGKHRNTGDTSGTIRSGHDCPYMATVCRPVLDFDADPVCSVTLGVRNVYACLVCGRWLTGRHPTSPAYQHSVNSDHHLFIRADDAQVFCLPEGYRVQDAELEDIQGSLRPIINLTTLGTSRTLRNGRRVGAVLLENLGNSDYASVILQLFLVATPVRDALINLPEPAEPPSGPRRALPHQIALLAKRIWSSHALHPHHAPHAVLRLISEASNQRFTADSQADPVELLAWLFNTYGKKGTLGQVLRNTFQGSMLVTTLAASDEMRESDENANQPFWFLTLDLPPKPLFKDENEDVLVPQVALEELLRKYDGVSRHHVLRTGKQRTYKLLETPQYLILVVRRFEKTKFTNEKNKCVVQTPVEGLKIIENGYKLVAAVVHDGDCEGGKYFIVFWHGSSENWLEITDENVTKCMPQLATLKETYLLMYRLEDSIE